MEKLALIGTFPPRECGIANFTRDLNEGLKTTGISTMVIAINDGLKNYNYAEDVQFEIEQNNLNSYIKASDFLNIHQVDAVILQHEYGIFGGNCGSHILQLLKRLRMPVITTLHTILDHPTKEQKKLLSEICSLSERVVSISQKGVELLRESYDIEPEKIIHIHHGAHEIKINNIESLKEKFGVKGKKILLTFGLLSKNKSIEVVINALPNIIKKHPDVLYIVLGATHPHVIKHDGEAYRHSLIRLANKLNLQEYIVFIDRYVSNKELFEFLTACDIYVIPYLGEKQISSGTLMYTMAAGKPIVSTPFWYAKEMLSENRGVLFEFNNSKQLSEHIIDLLEHDVKRKNIGNNALQLASQCYWPQIGQQYAKLIEVIRKENKKTSSDYQIFGDKRTNYTLPSLNLTQLRVLTDDTGILQHAKYTIPERIHGYCIDDNARALILSVMLQNETQNTDEITRLTSIYLSFISYALNPDNGYFRNFMSYDRRWLEEEGSEDSFGRTMWALGYTVSYTYSDNFYYHSNYLFHEGLKKASSIKHPKALAYLILGLCHYLQKYDDAGVHHLLKQKTDMLYAFFEKNIKSKSWLWYEPIITYGNSRIPQALIFSGDILGDDIYIQNGLKLLDWLIDKQFSNDIFSPIGNKGWLTPQQKAQYDQQPLEAHGMVDACLTASEITGNKEYADYAIKAFSWFTGDNDGNVPLYDFATGGCRDGLGEHGVNFNQGAESTLSWLLALIHISHYIRNKNK